MSIFVNEVTNDEGSFQTYAKRWKKNQTKRQFPRFHIYKSRDCYLRCCKPKRLCGIQSLPVAGKYFFAAIKGCRQTTQNHGWYSDQEEPYIPISERYVTQRNENLQTKDGFDISRLSQISFMKGIGLAFNPKRTEDNLPLSKQDASDADTMFTQLRSTDAHKFQQMTSVMEGCEQKTIRRGTLVTSSAALFLNPNHSLPDTFPKLHGMLCGKGEELAVVKICPTQSGAESYFCKPHHAYPNNSGILEPERSRSSQREGLVMGWLKAAGGDRMVKLGPYPNYVTLSRVNEDTRFALLPWLRPEVLDADPLFSSKYFSDFRRRNIVQKNPNIISEHRYAKKDSEIHIRSNSYCFILTSSNVYLITKDVSLMGRDTNRLRRVMAVQVAEMARRILNADIPQVGISNVEDARNHSYNRIFVQQAFNNNPFQQQGLVFPVGVFISGRKKQNHRRATRCKKQRRRQKMVVKLKCMAKYVHMKSRRKNQS